MKRLKKIKTTSIYMHGKVMARANDDIIDKNTKYNVNETD